MAGCALAADVVATHACSSLCSASLQWRVAVSNRQADVRERRKLGATTDGQTTWEKATRTEFFCDCVDAMRRLTGSTRQAVRRLGWVLEDRRLTGEQRRSVLGPAHRQWLPPTDDHRRYWSAYDWGGLGEEWTASPEWKRALIDEVLAKWIPENVAVLEIGPGAGRWSEALYERASCLVLVDVSERPLELCRERFNDHTRIQYILSSGSDLLGVEDGSIDAVWSFDVFVHVAPCDQAAYLEEIARVLAPGGIAVVHHADGRNRGQLPSRSRVALANVAPAFSQRWRSSADCRSSASLTPGAPMDAMT